MTWVLDPSKANANLRKHRISFEVAQDVFDDPFHLSMLDPNGQEERWRTIGQPFAHRPNVIFVVHTWPDEFDGQGRIISAREATKVERKVYEEAKWRAGFR